VLSPLLKRAASEIHETDPHKALSQTLPVLPLHRAASLMVGNQDNAVGPTVPSALPSAIAEGGDLNSGAQVRSLSLDNIRSELKVDTMLGATSETGLTSPMASPQSKGEANIREASTEAPSAQTLSSATSAAPGSFTGKSGASAMQRKSGESTAPIATGSQFAPLATPASASNLASAASAATMPPASASSIPSQEEMGDKAPSSKAAAVPIGTAGSTSSQPPTMAQQQQQQQTADGGGEEEDISAKSSSSSSKGIDRRSEQTIENAILTSHTHTDYKSDLVLNLDHFRDLKVGDYVEIYHPGEVDTKRKLLQQVTQVETRGSFTVSLLKSITTNPAFNLHTFQPIVVSKVDAKRYDLCYIEISFKDQYVSQGEFWRFRAAMHGRCCYIGQKLSVNGHNVSVDEMLERGNRPVACGIVRESTKFIFRSCSARVFWLVQMSKEMWNFTEDGELYFERFLNRFVTQVLEKWTAKSVTHRLTVLYFTRTYFDIKPPEGTPAVRMDYDGRYYTDLYHTVVENETRQDWISQFEKDKSGGNRDDDNDDDEHYEDSVSANEEGNDESGVNDESADEDENENVSFHSSGNSGGDDNGNDDDGNDDDDGDMSGVGELRAPHLPSFSPDMTYAGRNTRHPRLRTSPDMSRSASLDAMHLRLQRSLSHDNAPGSSSKYAPRRRSRVSIGNRTSGVSGSRVSSNRKRVAYGLPGTAQEGNCLEAINLCLNILDKHFMDRDLMRTGQAMVLVTAGSGVFEVDRDLTAITKRRMMDNAIGCDFVSLSRAPLHVAPLFIYKPSLDGSMLDILDRPHPFAAATQYYVAGSPNIPVVISDDDEKKRNRPILPVYNIPHWVHLSFPFHKTSVRPVGGPDVPLEELGTSDTVFAKLQLMTMGSFSWGEQFEPLPDNRMFDLTDSDRSNMPIALVNHLKDFPRHQLLLAPRRKDMKPWFPLVAEQGGLSSVEARSFSLATPSLPPSPTLTGTNVTSGTFQQSHMYVPQRGSPSLQAIYVGDTLRRMSSEGHHHSPMPFISLSESAHASQHQQSRYEQSRNDQSSERYSRMAQAAKEHDAAVFQRPARPQRLHATSMDSASVSVRSNKMGMIRSSSHAAFSTVKANASFIFAPSASGAGGSSSTITSTMNMRSGTRSPRLRRVGDSGEETSARSPREQSPMSKPASPSQLTTSTIEPSTSHHSTMSVSSSLDNRGGKTMRVSSSFTGTGGSLIHRSSASRKSMHHDSRSKVTWAGMSPDRSPGPQMTSQYVPTGSPERTSIIRAALRAGSNGSVGGAPGSGSGSVGLDGGHLSRVWSRGAVAKKGRQSSMQSSSGPSSATSPVSLTPPPNAAINPFDWSIFTSELYQERLTHNRRRWSHLFPTGRFDDESHGVRVEDYEEESSSSDEDDDGASRSGSGKQTKEEVTPLTIESFRLNWKSLQSPGILPLTTDYLPDISVFTQYTRNSYSLTMAEINNSGYETYEDLIMEMVCQRLSQDFQLIVANSSNNNNNNNSRDEDEEASVPENADSDNMRYMLTMGHEIHELWYAADAREVRVARYINKNYDQNKSDEKMEDRKHQDNQDPPIPEWSYEYLLYDSAEGSAQLMKLKFKASGAVFSWNKCDNLLCGYQDDRVASQKRYRRIMLSALPKAPKKGGVSPTGKLAIASTPPTSTVTPVSATSSTAKGVIEGAPNQLPVVPPPTVVAPKSATSARSTSPPMDPTGAPLSRVSLQSELTKIPGVQGKPNAFDALRASGATTGVARLAEDQVLDPATSDTSRHIRVASEDLASTSTAEKAPRLSRMRRHGSAVHTSSTSPSNDLASTVGPPPTNLAGWEPKILSESEETATINGFKKLCEWLNLKTKKGEKVEVKIRRRYTRVPVQQQGNAPDEHSPKESQKAEDMDLLIDDSALEPFTCKGVEVRVELPKKSDRYEWLVLEYDPIFSPYQTYHIVIQWMVAGGTAVQQFSNSLQRKAKLFGVTLQQIPEYCRSTAEVGSRRVLHPFVLPKTVTFPGTPLATNVSLLRTLTTSIKSRLDYASDSVFVVKKTQWPTLVHRNGYAFLHFSDDGIDFLQNRLLATSTQETGVYKATLQAFRDVREFAQRIHMCHSIVKDLADDLFGSLETT
ncbi:Vacuolar membrane-associated protein IML1, partial [Hondaea fermentalgiana]